MEERFEHGRTSPVPTQIDEPRFSLRGGELEVHCPFSRRKFFPTARGDSKPFRFEVCFDFFHWLEIELERGQDLLPCRFPHFPISERRKPIEFNFPALPSPSSLCRRWTTLPPPSQTTLALPRWTQLARTLEFLWKLKSMETQ